VVEGTGIFYAKRAGNEENIVRARYLPSASFLRPLSNKLPRRKRRGIQPTGIKLNILTLIIKNVLQFLIYVIFL